MSPLMCDRECHHTHFSSFEFAQRRDTMLGPETLASAVRTSAELTLLIPQCP